MKSETGMFSMADAEIVLAMELAEAKKYCFEIVAKAEVRCKDNIAKAKKMIDKAKNSTGLALGISNFILAHGDLKVIK